MYMYMYQILLKLYMYMYMYVHVYTFIVYSVCTCTCTCTCRYMHRHSTLHMYRPRIFRITLSLTFKTDRATVHSRLSCWPELSQSAAQWLVGFSLRHPCPSFSSYQQPAQQQSDRYHQQCITHPHACTCVSQLCSAHVHVHVIHMHKHV